MVFPILSESGPALETEDGLDFIILEDEADVYDHSPAEIVQQLLIDGGLGVDPDSHVDGDVDWPTYATNEPDGPDETVTVFDTQGQDMGDTQSDQEQQVHYGVQVRVRARSHETHGYRKANAIRRYLSEDVLQAVVTLDATRYLVHAVKPRGQVLALGKETPASKHSVFTANFTLSLFYLTNP